MNHQGTQIIETPRLILRPFQPEDASAMFEYWVADEEILDHTPWPALKTLDEVNQAIANWQALYQNPAYYHWCIHLKEIDAAMGMVKVEFIKEDVGAIDFGYATSKFVWNRGVATEANRAVIGFLFDQIGARRVSTSYFYGNAAAARVAEKCDMKKEGVLRQYTKNAKGEIFDTVVFSVLPDERTNTEAKFNA